MRVELRVLQQQHLPTLQPPPAGREAVRRAAFSDVLHQDLHQHAEVFLTQAHLQSQDSNASRS